MSLPASVADKRLTVWLSPLDATLTKTGEGTSFKPKALTSLPPYSITSRRLLLHRRYPDGFIHIGVGFLARFALALITMFKVLKIILKDSRANLGQAFLAGIVQCGLCLLLGTFVWMCTELLDGVEGAPVSPVLTLALPRYLLVQCVNYEIGGPQDEREARDGKAIVSVRAELNSQKMAEECWSHALRNEREVRKWKVEKGRKESTFNWTFGS